MLPTPQAGQKNHIECHATLHHRINGVISAREYGTNGAAIQAAITAADAAKVGEVLVTDGDWAVSQTITTAPGVDLRLTKQAMLRATANIDVVSLARGSSLIGGVVNCWHIAGYDRAAILLDGANNYYPLHGLTSVSDVRLIGNGSGAAIRMRSTGQTISAVTGVTFQNLAVNRFGVALDFIASAPETGINWINANMFSNISVIGGQYLMRMAPEGTGGCEISGNLFSNIFWQVGAESLCAVKLDAVAAYNQISNLMVFDWQDATGPYIVDIATLCRQNRVWFGAYADLRHIRNLGNDNIVTNVRTEPAANIAWPIPL
jgi:hypothetical protein